METELLEPDVWIEYQRVHLEADTFVRRSFADAIHRYDIMPDGCRVRGRTDEKTGEAVWEYLV